MIDEKFLEVLPENFRHEKSFLIKKTNPYETGKIIIVSFVKQANIKNKKDVLSFLCWIKK